MVLMRRRLALNGRRRVQIQFGNPKSKQNLATYFASLLQGEHCLLISHHTDGGLLFKTPEEGAITWYRE
jgi:hypothetical protein